ncbi:MAG TPA: hypothetical protein VIQ02_17980 [Jiangellaceae bacterium]
MAFTLDDLYAEIDPIATQEAFLAAWNDPQQRWYARRRLSALSAAGLIAATWNPNLHPRGRDGKFIEKFGFVRWLDSTWVWRNGYVTDIDPTNGDITVKGQSGNYFTFTDPKKLYARPKPKARMKLPKPGQSGGTADAPGFVKVGGQGGSNPGGFYEVSSSTAALAGPSDSPDISAGHKLHQRLRPLSVDTKIAAAITWSGFNDLNGASAMIPPDIDVMHLPRIDGTKDRYDVVVRGPGNQWYRVPTTGPMVTDDLFHPELAVTLDDMLGTPNSTRRLTVFHDDNVFGFTRDPIVDPDTLATAVRNAAADMPLEGDKYYVKVMKDEKRVRNEALANDLYELLGVAVPEVSIGEDPNTVASKLIGEHDDFDRYNPGHVKAAQDGFVADAWLANWDAVGLGFDNMQVTADGTVWRIDAGGALLYRAMESSGPKGAMFGPDVGELDSLRNPKINPNAAAVYGGISQEQLQRQGELLRSISPAQISELAETYGLPEVGTLLIARRKSVLDQLDIGPVPIPEPDVPDVVYNPVEQVTQPGKPPTTAVKNWTWQMSNLPKLTLTATDVSGDGAFLQNTVHVQQGELWVYQSDYTHQGAFADFQARNLFTDEVRTLHVYPGDRVLADYGAHHGGLDDLVNDLEVQRDLAITEIVASQDGRDMTDVLNDTDWKATLPANFVPYESTVPGLAALQTMTDSGYWDQNWPLRNTWNHKVYDVVSFDATSITLRESGQTDTVTFDQSGFVTGGPWTAPGNDTTAHLFRARLQPGPPAATPAATVIHGQAAETVATAPDSTGWNDISDDTPQAGMDVMANQMFNILNDPNISDADKDASGKEYLHYVNADKAGEPLPPTPTFDKLVTEQTAATDIDVALEALLSEEQAIADANTAAATHDIQIDTDSPLVKSLGPQSAILTSSMSGSADDKEELEKLIGTNVVVLPQFYYDNPDSTGTTASANGLGTVESVTYNTYGELWVGVATGNGGHINVRMSPSAPKKVIIPVATDPLPQQVTFKQNGTIVRDGDIIGTWEKVGYYGDWKATIHGDYSLTGKPIHTKTPKKHGMQSVVAALIVPVAPKPKKAKKPAVVKTEADIAALTAKYTAEFTPEVTAEAQAKFTALTPAPPGAPTLNDGTEAVKGNWVFSTKNGRWGQIVVAVPTYEKAKNKVRVKWQDSDGTWKQSHWLKSDLVSAPGQNQPPPALSTKLVTLPNGSKAGPGSIITTESGTTFTVLDTTVDGKIKVLNPTGNIQWGEASKAGNVVNVTEPGVAMSDTEVQAQVDAYISATVADKVAAALATDLAPPSPKKKAAPSVVTYPGPGGTMVKQDPKLAEERTQAGLKNLKDGNAPAVGQIVRHNDGTRYVVVEVGKSWTSAKNSVRVIPEGQTSTYPSKSRVVTTLVIDHEAMLTDSDGKALPRVTGVVGGAALPDQAVIWRRDKQEYIIDPKTGTYVKDPLTGAYRHKTVSSYYAIGPDGTGYDLSTGNQMGKWDTQNAMVGATRVAYVDTTAGDQQITLTTKPGKWGVVYIDAFIVHDADTDPMGLLAGTPQAPKDPKTPTPTISTPDIGETVTLSTGQSITAGQQYFTPQGEPITIKSVTPSPSAGVVQALIHSDQDGDEYWVGDAELVAMKLSSPTGTGFQAIKPGDTLHTGSGETFTVVNTSTTPTGIDAVLVDDEHGGQYWLSEQQLGAFTINEAAPQQQPTLTLDDGTEIVVGQQVHVAGAPEPGTVIGVVDDTITVQYGDGSVDYADKGDLVPTTTGISAPTPPPPVTPAPAGAPSDSDIATGDLVFAGTLGGELPHPKVTKAGVGASMVPQPTGKVGALDQKPATLPHESVNSVMDAVGKAKAKAAQNKATGQKQWVSTYALADSDAIDDMLIEVGLTRSGKGDDLVEVRFRLNNEQSKVTRSKLLGVGGPTQYGDWETIPYNPKDLTIGDQISVYVSGHEATQGMLKPAKTPDTLPNAIISGGPYLVGKNAAGTFDVYRFEVTFPNGDKGYMAMEDRGGTSIVTYQWNPTKERVSTGGSKALSGDAAADGWQVAHSTTLWERAGSEKVEHHADGVKKLPTPSHTKDVSGSGMVLRRGHNGAEVTFSTTGDRNNLDGEVHIRVAADDPDAQAKLSAAMELVGIPVDKQAPPTREQLTQMALNKVAKQFAPTYQRGVNTDATPDNPQSALALVDKAVGAKLGRPVTMDDISLRVAPDGRIHTLVSTDIAKAIVASNGAAYYQTHFRSDSDELTILSSLSGESTGLLSTVDRFRNGIFTTGESSGADHGYESAQRVYFTARRSGKTHGGATWMVTDPVAIHRHTDYHWQKGDSMGERPTNNLGWLTLAQAGGLGGGGGRNEMMLKRRFEPELWGRVTTDSDKRKRIIDELHKRGITHAPNGMLLEDFIVTGGVDEGGLGAPVWGDEVKLTELAAVP